MFELKVTIDGKKTKSIKLKRMRKGMRKNLIRGIDRATHRLEAWIKEKKLSGQVLKTRTSNLLTSWHSVPARDQPGVGVFGLVRSPVVYARIHEYGGIIKPKDPDGWLRFPIGGSWVTVKQVTIPARPYLRPAFKEKRADIARDIIRAVTKPLRGSVR